MACAPSSALVIGGAAWKGNDVAHITATVTLFIAEQPGDHPAVWGWTAPL